MIVLDTNVISEPLKLDPSATVLAWLDRQLPESLYITAVNVAELLDGVGRLPEGRRRVALDDALRRRVLPLFAGRVLPFDLAAAEAFVHISTRTRAAGLPISLADAYIAAIAQARGFMVASRDAAPFAAAGVRQIDPWAEAA